MSPKADGGADESAGEPRLIVANLGWEEELAGGTRPGERALSRRARSVVGSAAGWLRLLARDGDRLWVPDAAEAVDVEPPGGRRLVLPRVRLERGAAAGIAPATEVLAWGESPAVAALRRGSRPSGGAFASHGSLHQALWSLAPAPPEVAAACHHRAFALAAVEALQEARPREEGWALPGARMVASVGELERHLAAGGAAAGGGRWVLKSPWSAAGRGRHLGTGPGDLREPASRRHVERLLERHGSLLFEPWVDRLADFGAAALVTPEGLRRVGVHGQEVDGRGVFAAIQLAPELAADERRRLEAAVESVGERLRAAGYVGPFGVDAYRFRTPDGRLVFRPLSEVNARMTFGLLAHVLTGCPPHPLDPLPSPRGGRGRLTGCPPHPLDPLPSPRGGGRGRLTGCPPHPLDPLPSPRGGRGRLTGCPPHPLDPLPSPRGGKGTVDWMPPASPRSPSLPTGGGRGRLTGCPPHPLDPLPSPRGGRGRLTGCPPHPLDPLPSPRGGRGRLTGCPPHPLDPLPSPRGGRGRLTGCPPHPLDPLPSPRGGEGDG